MAGSDFGVFRRVLLFQANVGGVSANGNCWRVLLALISGILNSSRSRFAGPQCFAKLPCGVLWVSHMFLQASDVKFYEP